MKKKAAVRKQIFTVGQGAPCGYELSREVDPLNWETYKTALLDQARKMSTHVQSCQECKKVLGRRMGAYVGRVLSEGGL